MLAAVTSENYSHEEIEIMLILAMFPTIHVGIFYFPFLIQNRTGHVPVKGRLWQHIICLFYGFCQPERGMYIKMIESLVLEKKLDLSGKN